MSIPRKWPEGRAQWAVAAVAALVLLGPVAYALPPVARPFLWEPGIWGLAVLVSYWGYGALLARRIDARVDLALTTVWGAALVAVICGPLLALGVLRRPVLLGIVVVGNLLAVHALFSNWPHYASRARAVVAVARRRPSRLAPLAVILLVGGLQYVASVCDLYTNPYDDDIAYLPLVKRLHDIGNIDEPFSFRRISSFGGQTVFAAIDLLRGGFAHANLFDRGQCFILVLGLLAGHLKRATRPVALALVMSILYLANQEDIHINTASYFSGVAFFLALYRTQVLALQSKVFGWSVPAALLAAAAATLRQNYIPVAVLGLFLPHIFAWWDERRLLLRTLPKAHRRIAVLPSDKEAAVRALLLAGVLLLALAGYCVAAYRSNRTFLFPVALGTFNPAMQLKATVPSVLDELKLQLAVMVETEPLRTLMLIVPAALAFRDGRRGRPLFAFLCAAAFGFMFLTHSFTQADPPNISRYFFGFAAAAVLAVFIEVAAAPAKDEARPGVRGSRFAHFFLWAGLAVQVVWRRHVELPKHMLAFRNIAEAASFQTSSGNIWPVEADRYRRMQATVPAGAKLAILLDEPYHLDFARNHIANLDMPGYSSPGSRMPYFRGPGLVAEYLRGQGFSHVAFVRAAFSRYHYRRDFWVGRIFLSEPEVWRIFSAYLVDFVDNLAALAEQHSVLFEERGMVVMDLSQPKEPHETK